VNAVLRFALVAVLITSSIPQALAKRKAARASKPTKADIEAATRLQVFLDRANFGPGKIDGRYNDLTRKALAVYRESRGEQPQTSPPPQSKRKSNAAPDVASLDLATVDPVFIPDADLQNIGAAAQGASATGKVQISAVP
jgi:hypothetical protein